MPHYFTNDYVKSNQKTVNVIVKDTKLSFIVDNGVFSKKGLDFGTRTLLENINLNEVKGDVLDFGCGYGPIGIYLKKITNANIDMIDINERALKLANKNATLNNVKVNIFKSNIYESINDICSNLTKQNQNFIKQRDMLLPRLMSGKLEV